MVAGLMAWTSAKTQTLDWAVAHGGSQFDQGTGIAVHSDGTIVSVGAFRNSMDADPGPGVTTLISQGGTDWYIIKLSASGQLVWARSIGGTNNEEAASVAIDPSGNVIVVGWVNGTVDMDPGPGVDEVTTVALDDVAILKLDPDGNLLWHHVFGSNVSDRGRSVTCDNDGNIHLVGNLLGPVDVEPGPGTTLIGGAGGTDAFVMKLAPDGALIWAASMGGPSADIAHGVAVDVFGNVFVTGDFAATGDFDPGPGTAILTVDSLLNIFMVKLDMDGDLQWARSIGGKNFDRGRGVAVGPDGGPVFTGALQSTNVDLDPGPGEFIIPGNDLGDAFLVKLDAQGGFLWAIPLTSNFNIGLDVAVDEWGRIYVAGGFGTTSDNIPMDIDPGPGSTLLFTNGQSDGFLISYTAQGHLRWGFSLGSTANDFVTGIALGGNDRVHICGQFMWTVDMAPGPPVVNLTPDGLTDGFTATYTQPACGDSHVAAALFLEGPYRQAEQLMVDSLRAGGVLPNSEPYSAMGFIIDGPTNTDPSVWSTTGADAIVDWVLVEMRDAISPAIVKERRAALLQRDGNVVDLDGTSPVRSCLQAGPYHIALRHRNHLGAMTSGPITLSSNPVAVDLRDAGTPTFGTDARKDVDGTMMLRAGNALPDGLLKYTGLDNDRDAILARIGGTVPTATTEGYWTEDVNLDRMVKYVGANNDRDPILQNIGGVVPTATRNEQLP
jgi:hypothetical protein